MVPPPCCVGPPKGDPRVPARIGPCNATPYRFPEHPPSTQTGGEEGCPHSHPSRPQFRAEQLQIQGHLSDLGGEGVCVFYQAEFYPC